MSELISYSIVPLLSDHTEEIIEDIRLQYESGVTSCPLFMMTLVPEGNPPVDKAKLLTDRYRVFRDRLAALGIPSGVLIQATIGHGWKLSEPFPYQRFTGMRDGSLPEVVCPYDEGFREYLYDAGRTIASAAPCHIMLDDDMRLISRGTNGCGCPLHIKRFAELSGESMTREELNRVLTENRNHRLIDIYIDTQREAVVGAAEAIRAGIDSVDPTIPGSYCCVGNNAEFAAEIAKVMSGKGNPVTVRINNANYTSAGPRNVTGSFIRAACQTAKIKNDVDIILAETDTCPQNRYSTGAMALHTHYTGSILEGAMGAKHWITRLSAYEPESGKAYRKVLAKHRGFYEKLAEETKDVDWLGFRVPVLDKARYEFTGDWCSCVDGASGWYSCVLNRFGLPVFFSPENSGALCLDGRVFLSDEQIKAALGGTVLMASDSAKQLIDRGFGEYIGVDVREWTGKTPSLEIDILSGNPMNIQVRTKELVPVSDTVEEISYVCHTVDKIHRERLFPAVTKFVNSLGGTVYVFCGTPLARFDLTEAFSFLNFTRKRQITDILKAASEQYIYCPGDEEIYFRAGKKPDGTLVAAIFNIGTDPIDEPEIVSSAEIKEIHILTPDGKKEPLPFRREGERYILGKECGILDPMILFIRQ